MSGRDNQKKAAREAMLKWWTPENRKNFALKQRGTKNPSWKGDNVKMGGLHWWVKSKLPKTELCQECNLVPPRDLANKGIYNRDLLNWEWLCRRCHMTKDGRLQKLTEKTISYNNNLKKTLGVKGYKNKMKELQELSNLNRTQI